MSCEHKKNEVWNREGEITTEKGRFETAERESLRVERRRRDVRWERRVAAANHESED